MDDASDNKADNFIRTLRIKIEKYCMQNSTARSTFQFQIYKPEPKEDDVTVPFRFSFFRLDKYNLRWQMLHTEFKVCPLS